MSHVAPAVQAEPKLELTRQLCDCSLQLMWMLRQEALKAFEPLNMRPLQALVLELIALEVKHPKELADTLDLVPPAVSAILAELEERNLIDRRPDREDRRRVHLALTPAGERVREEMKRVWFTHSAHVLDKLTEDEIASLLAIYRKLIAQA